jgi:hypothetical protein
MLITAPFINVILILCENEILCVYIWVFYIWKGNKNEVLGGVKIFLRGGKKRGGFMLE